MCRSCEESGVVSTHVKNHSPCIHLTALTWKGRETKNIENITTFKGFPDQVTFSIQEVGKWGYIPPPFWGKRRGVCIDRAAWTRKIGKTQNTESMKTRGLIFMTFQIFDFLCEKLSKSFNTYAFSMKSYQTHWLHMHFQWKTVKNVNTHVLSIKQL